MNFLNTGTSLRCRPVAETLLLLKESMPKYGATRVTDTTLLDMVGMPVFAAIRPRAGEGSISVTSGKSLDADCACLGALAEAFELASAGYHQGYSELLFLNFEEYAAQCGYSPWSIPVMASQVKALRAPTPTEAMTYVECNVLGTSAGSLLPAACVYFPYHSDLRRDVYGTSTNGLASGNTLDEAILHALLEVIERDVVSFVSLGRETRQVTDVDSPDVLSLVEAVQRVGLELRLLHCPNDFDLPVFAAYLFDDGGGDGPVFAGYGAHLCKHIALLRACTEAVQSRLTNIHGARDDIIDYHLRWTGLKPVQQRNFTNNLRHRRNEPIAYPDIQNGAAFDSIETAISATCNLLRKNGFDRVCVYVYPKLVDGFHAVRVVVPGLEFYSYNRFRVGERLLSYAKSRI